MIFIIAYKIFTREYIISDTAYSSYLFEYNIFVLKYIIFEPESLI